MTTSSVDRRKFLALSAGFAALPYVWTSRTRAADRIVIRTPGGHRDDVLKEVAYLPFQKATGIEVVTVPAATSKLVAMTKMKQSEVDIVDNGTVSLTMLANVGALDPIPYGQFKHTDAHDLDAVSKREFYVANYFYATVLAYNTDTLGSRPPPKSWADFWNTQTYPGPRSLGSMDANAGDLELALLADGVPMDKLYPLDLQRAFASLTKIRTVIPKFWESGATCAQMLASKEVGMTSIWSDRLIPIRKQGAPVALTWNECRVETQAYGVMKYGSNPAGAKLFLDYAISPEVQSKLVGQISAVPANNKALPSVPSELIDPATMQPYMKTQGFMLNSDYWVEHIKEVSSAWSQWIASH